MYIKSTYDGLHVITGTTENVSAYPLNVKAIVFLNKFDAQSLYFSFKYVRAVLLSVREYGHLFCLFLLLVLDLSPAATNLLFKFFLIALVHPPCLFFYPHPYVNYSFCTLEVLIHKYKNNDLFVVENWDW